MAAHVEGLSPNPFAMRLIQGGGDRGVAGGQIRITRPSTTPVQQGRNKHLKSAGDPGSKGFRPRRIRAQAGVGFRCLGGVGQQDKMTPWSAARF